MDLNTVWFLLIGVLLAGYAVLDGFDLGVGVLHLFAREERQRRASHAAELRDHIIGTVLEQVPDARLTGDPTHRLPNHASFAFKGVDGNLLLVLLDGAGFACSSGSACKTGDPEPSEVLTSIGLSREWGLGSLRVTVDKPTTAAEAEAFLTALPNRCEHFTGLRIACLACRA